MLFHATPRHALMLRLHNDREAIRLDEAFKFVRELHRSLFLNLRTGEDPVRETRELGNADHVV